MKKSMILAILFITAGFAGSMYGIEKILLKKAKEAKEAGKTVSKPTANSADAATTSSAATTTTAAVADTSSIVNNSNVALTVYSFSDAGYSIKAGSIATVSVAAGATTASLFTALGLGTGSSFYLMISASGASNTYISGFGAASTFTVNAGLAIAANPVNCLASGVNAITNSSGLALTVVAYTSSAYSTTSGSAYSVPVGIISSNLFSALKLPSATTSYYLKITGAGSSVVGYVSNFGSGSSFTVGSGMVLSAFAGGCSQGTAPVQTSTSSDTNF